MNEGFLSNLYDGAIVKRDLIGRYIPIEPGHLDGKSVALYFAAQDCPKCHSFTPFLKQYYKSINDSGIEQKIEILFVSLDKDVVMFEEHRRYMPWLSVQFDSDLRGELISRYRVQYDRSGDIKRKAGASYLPRLLVIGPNGEQMHWLTCQYATAFLKEWDFYANKWPKTTTIGN